MDICNILDLQQEKVFSVRTIIDQFQKENKKKIVISSGSHNFNKVLGNRGFRSGNCYLIFGSNKTGKTQICHQLCVQNSKYSTENKNQYKTFYFDSENTFRPERLKEMALERGVDYDNVFKSVLVTKISDNSILLKRLNQLEDKLKNLAEYDNSLKILIIDSLNNYYRLDQGDKNLDFSQVKKCFLNILNKIYELTVSYNLITITTAQVAPRFSKGKESFIRENPVGHQYLNHYFENYLYLRHMDEKQNFIQLVNSHDLPEKRELYKITAKGIEDVKT